MLNLKNKKQKKLEEASFACIIPFKILIDPTITPSEKILYGIITGLTRASGICYASNGYFSKMTGLKRRQVIYMLNTLKQKKFISIEYGNNGKKTNRDITIPWMRDIKFK